MRVYISGGITGVDNYLHNFEKIERELRQGGFTVVNPARILAGLPSDTEYETYMKLSIIMLEECDAIFMLPNWQQSAGANRELQYALATNKIIMERQHDEE